MKSTLFLKIFLLVSFFILTSCVKKNHPPIIRDQYFSIAENFPSETLVGQVIAKDEDNDTSLTFLILMGNINDAFEFSETGGKLTINK